MRQQRDAIMATAAAEASGELGESFDEPSRAFQSAMRRQGQMSEAEVQLAEVCQGSILHCAMVRGSICQAT